MECGLTWTDGNVQNAGTLALKNRKKTKSAANATKVVFWRLKRALAGKSSILDATHKSSAAWNALKNSKNAAGRKGRNTRICKGRGLLYVKRAGAFLGPLKIVRIA